MSGNNDLLSVTLEARVRDFEKNMLKASSTGAQSFDKIERRAKQFGNRLEQSLRSSAANINGLLGSLGVGVGLNELRGLAEAWTDISSRANIAAGDQEKGAAVMQRISEIARRTYSDLGQTADAYVANSQALKDLGYSTATQLDYTEALNNALVVSGAKGQQAGSVMDALSKAMALGELRGDNLNTVISTGGRVAQALADGLGTTVSKLRQLGQEGKLTGDVVVKALTGQLVTLREEAESMPATITDAFVILKNSMTEYVGRLNEAKGATAILSDGIILAADNIGSIAAAAAAAGAVLLGKYVPGLVRATAAQAAMVASNPFLLLATAIAGATFALSAFGGEIQPVAGEMANLHDYAGAAWDTIRDGALTAGRAINDTLITAINFITNAIGGAEVSFGDLGDFVKTVVNEITGQFVFVYDTIVNVFTKLPAAIAEAVLNAMNSMIAGVETGLNGVISAVNSTITAMNSLGDHVGLSLGTIGNVTLGRIENTYAGAGEAAGEAYGQALKNAADDHVGNALGAWRKLANERAAARQTVSAPVEIESVDSPISPKQQGNGSKGGGGKKSARGSGSGANDFDRQVKQLQERIAGLRAETDARRNLTGSVKEQEAAVERARLKHELLTAAQNAGLTITPELEARIDALAQSYSDASGEAQALAQSQQNASRRAEEFKSMSVDLVKGFISDLRSGKDPLEALLNGLNKVADKLIDMAINNLFENAFGGGGGFLSSLFGGIGGGGFPAAPVGLFADGGYTGRGGKHDPAGVVHKGEVVWSQRDVARVGGPAVAEAIRTGRMPGYADGGIVGGHSKIALPGNQPATSIAISAPITVNGSAGTPEQNNDLAKKISRDMEASMRGIVCSEIQKQMRPGNMFSTRGR